MAEATLQERLTTLGLEELLPQSQEGDLPYPLPRKRILRLLEVASTQFPDKAVEIMQLHRDIIDGKVE